MKKTILAWLVCSSFISGVISAQPQIERGLNVGLEVTPTDNVYQEVDDPESDTEVALQIGANLQSTNQIHTFNLDYQGKSSEYLDESFSQRHSINGTARLDVFTTSRTFGWFISNDEQDTVINVVGPDTPDNRSQRRLTQTGPILNFRLDATDSLQVAHVWSQTDIENSDADSDAVSTSAKWTHRFNSNTALSLLCETTEVEPEIFVVDTYTQKSFGIELEKNIRYGTFTTYVGSSSVDDVTNMAGDELDANVYDVSLKFFINRSSLMVSTVKNLQGSGGNGYYSDASFDIGSETFAIELSKRDLASLSIPLGSGRSILIFDYFAVEAENTLNESVRRFGTSAVSISRSFANNQQLILRYAKTNNHIDLNTSNSEFERKRYTLAYQKDLGENFNMSCGIFRSESVFGDVAGTAEVNSGFCSFGYKIF